MEYRRDIRTEEEFAKDIKECSNLERKLMKLYVAHLNRLNNGGYSFLDNGVDNSGGLIVDNAAVDCRADFILRSPNQEDTYIDIKFSRKENRCFHFKVNQVKNYIRDGVSVVNFMGIDTDEIRFSFHDPASLQNALENNKRVFFKAWGGKECIKFDVKDQTWFRVL